MEDFASEIQALQLQAAKMQYNRLALSRFTRCLQQLRGVGATMNIQAAHIYMEVVIQQGITVGELIRKTGLSQASCSRNLALLSKVQRHGRPGFDLVVSLEDPYERRRKVTYLTPRGGELAAALSDIFKSGRQGSELHSGVAAES
ncbi:MarR family winged helix-turn-helix transcriptional regulator [Halomonas daqiaonensis]|uniref:DNA-binding transcriptional regulator, MarR family n=1 Tax=Halomonas daqiaonensis TaxID=650850 RepID=A0A1H7QD21_9GAMM|nr:MarR family winged helix-turn-helix transcriptional regulator [Halomonas daqiaonensis]SEL45197.1 DNA-binding transcriptional regulator, MarR family [Halomonas daqiaonensis]